MDSSATLRLLWRLRLKSLVKCFILKMNFYFYKGCHGISIGYFYFYMEGRGNRNMETEIKSSYPLYKPFNVILIFI